MLACTYKIKILALYLIHHLIHFFKAHYACYHLTSDHIWRYAVGKTFIYHKIPCIGKNSGMKPCDITHKIIKAASCNLSGCLQVDSVYRLHNIGMIGHFKIRHNRFPKSFYLYIFGIILSDRNTIIYNIRNNEHYLIYTLRKLVFLLFKLLKSVCKCIYFRLRFLSLFFFPFSHKLSDFLRDDVSLIPKLISFGLRFSYAYIKLGDLINKRKLIILKFLFYILLNKIGIFPDQLYVYHLFFLLFI